VKRRRERAFCKFCGALIPGHRSVCNAHSDLRALDPHDKLYQARVDAGAPDRVPSRTNASDTSRPSGSTDGADST